MSDHFDVFLPSNLIESCIVCSNCSNPCQDIHNYVRDVKIFNQEFLPFYYFSNELISKYLCVLTCVKHRTFDKFYSSLIIHERVNPSTLIPVSSRTFRRQTFIAFLAVLLKIMYSAPVKESIIIRYLGPPADHSRW